MNDKKYVYVVVGGWQWEGFDTPIAVFTDKEKAHKWTKLKRVRDKQLCGYDYVQVVSLEVK